MLARRGETILPRAAYERYLKNGILEKPMRRSGERPYHTIGQVEKAVALIAARIATNSPNRNIRNLAAQFNK